ncbi:hypothetical protein C8J56DRAFT_1171373 [Mycena floridula]|nr:hypothetical protein C8J56DRAFT_1171889 [Mycena floridula]KAJ7576575.1 hypothetical protein C8J56DRAFT_1171373 [Mycena floridula]
MITSKFLHFYIFIRSSMTPVRYNPGSSKHSLGRLWLIASSVYLPQYCWTAVQRSVITGITKGADFVTRMMLLECSPLVWEIFVACVSLRLVQYSLANDIDSHLIFVI